MIGEKVISSHNQGRYTRARFLFTLGSTVFKSIVLPVVAVMGVIASAHADEGQWQPHQLPQLKSELKRIGITIPAEKIGRASCRERV